MLPGKHASSTASVQTSQALSRSQIPIEPAAPPLPHSHAISCLGAFRTPVASALGSIVNAGVRKPAQEATYAPQQTAPLFDHLVGAGEECSRYPQANCFR